MDQTLLQKREGALPETAERSNNDTTEIEQPNQEYRNLKIEPPRLPLRMILTPPLDFDGQKYEVLIFDFDAMTGKDFQRAEREFTHRYKPEKDETVLPEMKHLYHQIIAAHRANVPLGVIQKLPRRYYTPLRIEVLKACGSSPEEDKA